MGLRVLRKVERIIREEMDRAGALEISMPVAQPGELWVESGRWEQYGPELLRFKDRHDRDMVLGPTHEEVITDLARRELKSYRQLPVNFYQIQTKFRDEIRPRFGVMRAREFVMKDAYSFHADAASLEDGYQRMHAAYTAIFTRLQLDFRAVLADTGAIGGNVSQEFHVLANSGEDAIAFSDGDDYAANLEMAAAAPPTERRPAPKASWPRSQRPAARTIAEVSAFLEAAARATRQDPAGGVGRRRRWSGCVVRGDHELNAVKAQKLPGVASPLRMAQPQQNPTVVGCEPGFIGPVGLGYPAVCRPLGARARRLRLRRQRARCPPDRGQLADATCPSPAPRTCATWSKAIRAPAARAACGSRAASRWATYSSSAASTARRWARRCSTSRARASPCPWAATGSA